MKALPRINMSVLGHVSPEGHVPERDMELRVGRGTKAVSGSNCGNWPPCHNADMRRSAFAPLPNGTRSHAKPAGWKCLPWTGFAGKGWLQTRPS